MIFELFKSDAHVRRFVYPIWLRIFTLLAVVVLVILLAVPSVLFSSSDSSLPWKEELRVFASSQPSEIKLALDRPQITRILRYKTEVEQEGSPRGSINLLIYPNGSIRGIWNGEYDQLTDNATDQAGDAHYSIIAACFAGNVDPSRPFVENGSRSFSNLFFLTRGTFSILKTQRPTGQSRGVCGFIYVRGWLYPDLTAVGEIFVTEDKKSFDRFDWVAQPAD